MHLISLSIYVDLVRGRIPKEWEKTMHSFYQEYKEEAPKGSQNIQTIPQGLYNAQQYVLIYRIFQLESPGKAQLCTSAAGAWGHELKQWAHGFAERWPWTQTGKTWGQMWGLVPHPLKITNMWSRKTWDLICGLLWILVSTKSGAQRAHFCANERTNVQTGALSKSAHLGFSHMVHCSP